MDTDQNRTRNTDNSQQPKAGSKQNQKKKSTTEKNNTTKIKPQKNTPNESKGSSDLKLNSVGNKSSAKEESKENNPPKKQGKRKGKKATKTSKGLEPLPEVGTKTLQLGERGSRESKKQRKVGVSELNTSQDSRPKLNVAQVQQCKQLVSNVSALEYVQKTSLELSKAKKRRNRKKRVLEALGISLENKAKSNKAQKPRKRKLNVVRSTIGNGTSGELDTSSQFGKSLVSKEREKSATCVEKNGNGISKSKTELHSRTSPLRSSKDAFEGPQAGEGLLDQISVIEDKKKSDRETVNSELADDVCSSGHGCTSVNNSDNLNLPVAENNSQLDVIPQTLTRREDSASTERINITNFLSHDNVQGLFRSALLSDITVSSRCSEKEVKNFFNTYGTFSERNRSQFAAVEKLLLSNEKTEESPVTSNLFDSKSFNSDLPLKTTGVKFASINKIDSSVTQSSGNVSLVSPSKNIDSDANISVGGTDNLLIRNHSDVDISCNLVGKSCGNAELTENLSLITGAFIRAPIYTSPNLENKVTNSVNSNQIGTSSGNKNIVGIAPFDFSLTNNCTCVVSEQDNSRSNVVEVVEDILSIEKESNEPPEIVKNIKSSFSNDLVVSNQNSFLESEGIEDKPDLCNISRSKREVIDKTISETKQNISCNTVQDCPVTSEDSSKPSDNILNCKLKNCYPLEETNICDILKSNEMYKTEKSREEVKAEREAKKAAKISKKLKTSSGSSQSGSTKSTDNTSPVLNEDKDKNKLVVSVTAVKSEILRDVPSLVATSVPTRDAGSPLLATVPKAAGSSVLATVPKAAQSPEAATVLKAAQSPETTTVLKAAQSPEAATVSKAAQSPVTATVPKAAQSPGAATVLKAAQSPVTATVPKPAQSPLAATVPKAAPSPVTATVPKAAPSPVTATVPKAAQSPVTATVPIAAQSPVTATVPIAAQSPVTATVPIAAQSPVTATVPKAAQCPVTATVPKAAQCPVTATVPKAAQCPVTATVPKAAQCSVTATVLKAAQSPVTTTVLKVAPSPETAIVLPKSPKITTVPKAAQSPEAATVPKAAQSPKTATIYTSPKTAKGVKAAQSSMIATITKADQYPETATLLKAAQSPETDTVPKVDQSPETATVPKSPKTTAVLKAAQLPMVITTLLKAAQSPGAATVPKAAQLPRAVTVLKAAQLPEATTLLRDAQLTGPATSPNAIQSPVPATIPRNVELTGTATASKKNRNQVSGRTEEQTSKTVSNLAVKTTDGGVDVVNKTDPRPSISEVARTRTETKSKAELRAERRAKQEAQRAAKAASGQQQVAKKVTGQQQAAAPSEQQLKGTEEVVRKVSRAVKAAEPGKVTLQHKVKLFNHLYHKQEASSTANMLNKPQLHPAIIRLGVQYATKVVIGSNARCVALLNAMKQLIEDYKTPPQKEFSRGLESSLQPCVTFLQECRPLSVSMTNALKHLKWQMTQLPNTVSDTEAKKKLQEAIDVYIREQIEVAGQAICNTVLAKISSGDVILTYGCSSLLQRILIKAHKSGTKFRVVVVDGRPWREGKEMLRRLVESGLHCSYVLIPAASFIMREVTKVFLGAHALLANGYVMSRAGSSQVALLAHSYNVPVLVCCETHKFCERVQTDSFVYNELGDPDDLVETGSCAKERPLSKWRTISNLTPLNLTYDVTPPDLVTAVVTELAILPCTSVPVILRIKPTETGC